MQEVGLAVIDGLRCFFLLRPHSLGHPDLAEPLDRGAHGTRSLAVLGMTMAKGCHPEVVIAAEGSRAMGTVWYRWLDCLTPEGVSDSPLDALPGYAAV